MLKSINNNRLLCFALFLIFCGLFAAGHFLYSLSLDYTPWGETSINITETGAVGDFIAGVVGTLLSLAGFIMVYLTYNDQRKTNEKDKKEARIFTLIQIHVDNADNVSYNNPYNNGE